MRTYYVRNYQNAILFNDNFEEKVANIVMGLEALFLSGEKNELSFRLKTRICKLLSYFDYDTIELRRLISIAYMGVISEVENIELKNEIIEIRNSPLF